VDITIIIRSITNVITTRVAPKGAFGPERLERKDAFSTHLHDLVRAGPFARLNIIDSMNRVWLGSFAFAACRAVRPFGLACNEVPQRICQKTHKMRLTPSRDAGPYDQPVAHRDLCRSNLIHRSMY